MHLFSLAVAKSLRASFTLAGVLWFLSMIVLIISLLLAFFLDYPCLALGCTNLVVALDSALPEVSLHKC